MSATDTSHVVQRQDKTAMPPRLGALLRLLASDRDGEVLGACRAIGRALTGAGADWNTLADAAECGWHALSAERSTGTG
jgi:hypothetical protein